MISIVGAADKEAGSTVVEPSGSVWIIDCGRGGQVRVLPDGVGEEDCAGHGDDAEHDPERFANADHGGERPADECPQRAGSCHENGHGCGDPATEPRR